MIVAPLGYRLEDCCTCYSIEEESDIPVVEENYDILFTLTPVRKDSVNHPDHYNRTGAMECLEEMVTVFGIDAVIDFCKCNVWKYRYRANDKNGDEDIRKSDKYMQFLQELEGRKNK